MNSLLQDLDRIVITSDSHYDHANIVKFCGRPENHNELMIENWYKAVHHDDIFIHLGDLAFRLASNRYLDAIRGAAHQAKMSILILGNHDHGKKEFYEGLGFQVAALPAPSHKNQMQGGIAWLDWEGVRVALSHVPCYYNNNFDINIHGHIHNGGYPTHIKEMNKDHRNICVEVTDYSPVRLLDQVLNGSGYESVRNAPTNDNDDRLNDMKGRHAERNR